jgi:hypothetical protein
MSSPNSNSPLPPLGEVPETRPGGELITALSIWLVSWCGSAYSKSKHALIRVLTFIFSFTTRSLLLTRVPLLPEHRDHLERPTTGTPTYKPYIAFHGCTANAAPHVLVPHIPASNLTSPIATSTPADTPFQFSDPGSTPILHSGTPIPMSTPPPVATTPITPTRHLSRNSDLSPNQLPFEMLDLGHITRRSHQTWSQSDAVPSRRDNSHSRSPNISHHTSYAGQYDVCP